MIPTAIPIAPTVIRWGRTTATALFSASFNVMSSANNDEEPCQRLAAPERNARCVPWSRTGAGFSSSAPRPRRSTDHQP